MRRSQKQETIGVSPVRDDPKKHRATVFFWGDGGCHPRTTGRAPTLGVEDVELDFDEFEESDAGVLDPEFEADEGAEFAAHTARWALRIRTDLCRLCRLGVLGADDGADGGASELLVPMRRRRRSCSRYGSATTRARTAWAPSSIVPRGAREILGAQLDVLEDDEVFGFLDDARVRALDEGEALVRGPGVGVPGAKFLRGELVGEPRRKGDWSTRRFWRGSWDGRGEKTCADAIIESRSARLPGPART
ncbi:hypothetical protein B0H14DRAFT_3172768 [Mycena olivaceomarginata]|nr:hypothetical protein B0H14DRAFT_3172768 [Mycena olivaceomarginata]